MFRLCIAINAAINAFFTVGELEHLRQLLLYRRDAARIAAADHVGYALRQLKAVAFDELAVLMMLTVMPGSI